MSSRKPGSLKKAVAAAGTAEPLSSTTQRCSYVEIKALAGNSGDIYVGGYDVASTNGYVLDAGEVLKIEASPYTLVDLKDIYVDTSSNGDTVTVFYQKG